MIRDGIKLQDDVLERLPGLIQAIKQRSEVVALYSFGSVAKDDLEDFKLFRQKVVEYLNKNPL